MRGVDISIGVVGDSCLKNIRYRIIPLCLKRQQSLHNTNNHFNWIVNLHCQCVSQA